MSRHAPVTQIEAEAMADRWLDLPAKELRPHLATFILTATTTEIMLRALVLLLAGLALVLAAVGAVGWLLALSGWLGAP